MASYYSAVGGNYSSSSVSDNAGNDTGSYVNIENASHGLGYSAQAYAEYGATHAGVSTVYDPAPVDDGYLSATASAAATAEYSDWFIITGGSGEASASVTTVLEGTLSGGGTGYAGVSFDVAYTPDDYCWDCGTSYEYQSVVSVYDTLGGRQTSSSVANITGEFTFTYDEPFQLTTTLSVFAQDGGYADYLDTASLLSFALPAGASLQSSSGLFVASVPEPETYAMLLAGLGLMAGVVRRRRLQVA
ncbi:PEP-CTERM sorting domain-containing protein [Parasulfuritortus cantonensis]|uniref:PEP-CTERM sorting domain-containing protein n=2 Tax=Parasulfuritortus cantonensis TaxID=2528202 RepID=A0A4R1BGU3_9PROT|nr:PEP-CTERM sorting domain-containing protein [Parasulfuritortus cantonensis]